MNILLVHTTEKHTLIVNCPKFGANTTIDKCVSCSFFNGSTRVNLGQRNQMWAKPVHIECTALDTLRNQEDADKLRNE